ncbi:MAG: metallophosphoesterase, partial [Bacteroidota bacterium]
MSFFLFFAFWLSLIALAHWYVGRRVINAATLQGVQRRVAWLVVAAIFLVPQIPFFLFINGVQSTLVDVLSSAGYVVLGFFSLVLTFFVLRDLVILVSRGIMKLHSSPNVGLSTPAYNVDRRRFILHSSNIGIIGFAAAATGYGLTEARRRATIERVEVPLHNLPDEFDGFRIVQFTDLHVGPTIKREFVEGIAEQVQGLKGDLIAFTGDLADGSVAWLRDDVTPLRELSAPHGKFFVTGNHEYYSGAEPWVKETGRLGFDVLVNEYRLLTQGNSSIVLAGITDYSGGDFIPSHKSDPTAALASAPDGCTRILLAHQPRSIYAAKETAIDLQLSGHTHGGQFFPWNHLATLNQPYIKGLHRHENTWIYVSRGTGYWGPPLRMGVPPEITVITLRR